MMMISGDGDDDGGSVDVDSDGFDVVDNQSGGGNIGDDDYENGTHNSTSVQARLELFPFFNQSIDQSMNRLLNPKLKS